MIKSILLGFLLMFVINSSTAISEKDSDKLPRQVMWDKRTLVFEGPNVNENSTPNPFLDYRLVVDFISPTGKENIVYGYYAADGNAAYSGANSGNKWKVNFIPNEPGTWFWIASFRQGSNIGISTIPSGGTAQSQDNSYGFFEVAPNNKSLNDPTKLSTENSTDKGMLKYSFMNHMIYAGNYTSYIKTGTDSAENFLAYRDFDQTYDLGGLFHNFIHGYDSHVNDWKEGNPTWQGTKGKGIIGALNYLASVGVNSIYVITYTIDGGDGMDVWPWTTPSERYRFDVSKLDQWEIVFDYTNKLGIQIHMIFQENENTFGLGNENDIRRQLYYKELVSRFGHLLALQFNLGEEDVSSTKSRIAYAKYINFIDPYDHPIAVHTNYNDTNTYNGLYGSPYFSASSFQGDGSRYESSTTTIRNNSNNSGRPWVIYGDEQGPDNLNDVNLMVSFFLNNIMAGGAGCEFYAGYPHDMTLDDFRIYEPLWIRIKKTRNFVTFYSPIHFMVPDNSLATNGAKVLVGSDAYLVYLPSGGSTTLTIRSDVKNYIRWFNITNGNTLLSNPTYYLNSSRVNVVSPFGNNGSLAIIGTNPLIESVDSSAF